MTARYTYEQKMVRMRWIDFCRIQKAFPPLKDETTSSYFQRLAMWLKEQKK